MMDRVDTHSPVSRLREDGWFLRTVSVAVTLAFLWLLVYPDLLIAKEADAARNDARPVHRAQPGKQPDRLNETLETLRATVADVGFGLNAVQRKPRLRSLREKLRDAHEEALAGFERDARHIERHDLPEVIRERHRKAVAEYKAKADEALARIESVLDATLPSQASERARGLADWLDRQKTRRSHQPFDPENLPFSVPDASKTRKPKTTRDDYASMFPEKPIQLAAAGDLDPAMLAQAADTPGPEHLQPTEDVQITEAVEDKAAELNHDPVRIYNWVRNNVEFIPTYKSIQGSDLTLQTERGNAFDTASLLIALLRASDIPARYVYGTVEMPVDKVMNWVGGVEVPEAALQLLGQGGIPNTGLSQGGRITHVQLEHIWVEAWIDYEPSRGAKHIEGDTWVPMDASFKQYSYTDGMNVDENVPFDAQGFADQIEASATINEEEGWVQGMDQAYIQNEFQSYLDQLNAYVENQDPNATVGEVLGTKTIDRINPLILPAGLPYKLRARGGDFATIPDNMRTYFHYRLYASERDRAYDSPAMDYRASLPSLANKRITLSFEPATEEDRETIESYLPEPDGDGEIDPNDLPESLPGYLIELTAQLKIDGQVVVSAGSYAMGKQLATRQSITRLTGGVFSAYNNPTAGEFHAIGLRYQGGQGQSLEVIQQNLETVRTQLENQQFDAITKDALVGELLNAGVASYFAALDAKTGIQNQAGEAIVVPHPGFGAFNTSLQSQYRFGTPRDVLFEGIGVDIDAFIVSGEGQDADPAARINAVRQIGGQASALEHRIPELIFTSPDNPAEAISAVKAIAVAQAQGQRVYTIDKRNPEAINA